MTQFINPNNFNPASLIVDDVYALNYPPQSYVQGVPVSNVGIIGTASWGPMNLPVVVGSPSDLISKFGTVSAARLTGGANGGIDPFDLAWADINSLNQVQGSSGLTIVNVRAGDGTQTQASGQLGSASSTVCDVETCTFGGSATTGQIMSITITNANLPSGAVTVTYTATSLDTLGTITAAFAAVINANAALFAQSIFAVAALDVLTINYLSTIGSTTFSKSAGTGSTTLTLASGSATTSAFPGINLQAFYTGILGNSIQGQVLAGANGNLLNVVVPSWSGGPQENYFNLPNTTGFWQALYNQLTGGSGPTIAPSRLLAPGLVSAACPAPAVGATFALSGGTDGRSGIISSNLVGTAAAKTGIYALAGLSNGSFVPIGGFWIAGFTDSTQFGAMQAFADSIGAFVFFTFASGTSVSAAASLKSSLGIDDYNCFWGKDWLTVYDSINGIRSKVDPPAVMGGLIASLAPQINPTNKAVFGVLGTDNTIPYSVSDLATLTSNGILVITNPIVRGPQWGFRNGRNGSSNQSINGIEYTRMTNFLLSSIANNLGQFEGDPVGYTASDPTMNGIEMSLTTFLQNLKQQGQIVDFSAECDLDNNTSQNVAQGIVYVNVDVQYLSVARFIVFKLQGGATVLVNQNVISNQPIAA